MKNQDRALAGAHKAGPAAAGSHDARHSPELAHAPSFGLLLSPTMNEKGTITKFSAEGFTACLRGEQVGAKGAQEVHTRAITHRGVAMHSPSANRAQQGEEQMQQGAAARGREQQGGTRGAGVDTCACMRPGASDPRGAAMSRMPELLTLLQHLQLSPLHAFVQASAWGRAQKVAPREVMDAQARWNATRAGGRQEGSGWLGPRGRPLNAVPIPARCRSLN